MAKAPVDRIVAMLGDDAPERRLAAAIVLGEIAPKKASVRKALAAVLAEDGPAIQRHVLDALGRLGVTDPAPIWPLLESRDADVREAASRAVATMGEAVVPTVRARLQEAEGDGRRALESILSRLGGGAAFDALLDALLEGDEESNRATALELRQQIRDADAATRRKYRTKLEKLLTKLKKAHGSPSATAAAVKVLGYLEDPKSADTLVAFATDRDAPPSVRTEALIALRFTMADGASEPVVKALVDAAQQPDRALAQTALMSLAQMALPAALAPTLSELALHRDLDRASMAIDKLGSLEGKRATQTLVEIVGRGDKRRAELAAAALGSRTDALGPLVDLAVEADEPERAKLLQRVLKPHVHALTSAMRKALTEEGAERIERGSAAWQAPLALVAEAAPDDVQKRLRAAASKLKKGRKLDAEMRVLRALWQMGLAGDDDLFRLASRRLSESKLDPRTRRSDSAIARLSELVERGYDVVAALKKERSASLEALYYVGFCFIEDDLGGGEELLEVVVEKGGRKKIAKAAKNKLKLSGWDG